MTAMSEAALASKLDLPYAATAVVVNHAAGRTDSRQRVDVQKMEAILGNAVTRARRIIEALVGLA